MDLSRVPLRVSLVLCILGRKATKVKCPPRHLIQKYLPPAWFITSDVNLGHLIEAVFVRFLSCKITPPTHTVVWGESHCAHTLRPSKSQSHLLEGALIFLRYLDSCTDIVYSLFSHVYQDSWIYILHFGLYFDYYLIYFAAQCFYFYSLLCNK